MQSTHSRFNGHPSISLFSPKALLQHLLHRINRGYGTSRLLSAEPSYGRLQDCCHSRTADECCSTTFNSSVSGNKRRLADYIKYDPCVFPHNATVATPSLFISPLPCLVSFVMPGPAPLRTGVSHWREPAVVIAQFRTFCILALE